MGGKLTKKSLVTDRPLYDRQPGEPDKAWGVFVVYRDMGPERSIRKAESKYKEIHGGKGDVNYCEKLSVRWRWRERIEAWDRDLDRRLRSQRIRSLEEMRTRHIEIGKSLQSLGVLGAKQIQDEIKRAAANNEDVVLSAKDLVSLIEAGTKIERLNRGEPESIQESRHSVDVGERRKILQRIARDPDLVERLQAAIRGEADEDDADGD